jgi:hypothetical protein
MRDVQIRSLRERFLRRLRLDEPAESTPSSPSPALTPPRGQASLAPARVLLVASDRRFRALEATLLSLRGHEVVVARKDDDGSEA